MTRDAYINGDWCAANGDALATRDSATGAPAFTGRVASASEVDDAVAAARDAFEAWSALPPSDRTQAVRAFAEAVSARRDELARAISSETGKPLWESHTEVNATIGKVDLSLDALSDRRAPIVKPMQDMTAATRYKPHGVMAVFGPFNLPSHLPNGHIVPALLAGNTVVLKPSEKTPGVGAVYAQCWADAQLPAGVFNMVQGARATGEALASHAGVDGLLFTGGCAAGTALSRALADQPQKLLALEMGGNNPLVVDDVADLHAAAVMTILSAYITAGQRCTCARRLIVLEGDRGDAFVRTLIGAVVHVRAGVYTDKPEPFMGPVVNEAAAAALLDAEADLASRGGKVLVEMRRPQRDHPALLSPGLIDVTAVADRDDVEHFGPLLQLIRVPDFDAAIVEANDTRFGLAAGLLSDSRERFESFHRRVRAGVINWNRQTTGASGAMPFGGVGMSGNHRPAGYWAADYCSYPVASLESERLATPDRLPAGLNALVKPDDGKGTRDG